VDLSKFKTPDWLIVGGGVLFLIGGFMEWVNAEASAFGTTISAAGNAFDFFFTGIVPWLLIIATAVLTVLLLTGTVKAGTAPWPMIFVAATALAALLVLLRFIAPGLGEDAADELGDVDYGRGIGLWLCLIAAILAVVGAVMNFNASGGSLSHFTDPDKLKGAFGGAGSGTAGRQAPPPPPPGAAPPPPRPPAAGPGDPPPPPPVP
jgi:hypothetical protein